METLTLGMTTITAAPTLCSTTVVPASGLLTLANSAASCTLAQAAVYQVPCPTVKPHIKPMAIVASGGSREALPNMGDSSDARFSDFRDPFYASTFPICYALAATTVTAWMLLIMLFITPRSFLDGGVVYLGRRRAFTHSSSGGESIGGRPWLQKVATLTVAVSLTIASHDTFRVAHRQYQWGAQNAGVLQSAVMGSVELRVIRLISNTFLWLAQAQTLIRLFPRHREKVIIKWAAFALITLDLIFSAINSFKDREKSAYPNTMGGGSFDHPIPAFSYLFQLLLGVLYAAWVIYYSLMKKRYAYYHPLMKNMPFLAVVSLTAILVPVVVFIMDISKPEFTAWGDYVRWVGAAAASVIVWEWVERIEALEREEKKDGILGREVFDGDETLEVNASEFPWLRNRRQRKDDGVLGSSDRNGGAGGDGVDGGSGARGDEGLVLRSNGWPGVTAMTGRQRGQARDGAETRHRQQRLQHRPTHHHHDHEDRHHLHRQPQERQHEAQPQGQDVSRIMGEMRLPPLWPSRPAPTATPASRTDTPSAASTVYAVRYQATSDAASRTPDLPARTPDPWSPPEASGEDVEWHAGAGRSTSAADQPQQPVQRAQAPRASEDAPPQQSIRWTRSTPGASPRRRGDSHERLATTTRQPTQEAVEAARRRDPGGRWDVRSRLELFAANQAERLREKLRPTANTDSLPVTIIPAPARRGAALQQVLEEEEAAAAAAAAAASAAAAAAVAAPEAEPATFTTEVVGSRGGREEEGIGPSSSSNNNKNNNNIKRREDAMELAQLGRLESSTSAVSAGVNEVPAANPPLWPGVRRRPTVAEADDAWSFDEASTSDSASMELERRGSAGGPAEGPGMTTTTTATPRGASQGT